MVDVSAKQVTKRTASAEAVVMLSRETIQAVVDGTIAKGDVVTTAKVAAVMAVKKTPELIPLCHPVRVDQVSAEVAPVEGGIRVRVDVGGSDRTGFEMEALCGAAAAALTIYDMIKSREPGAEISRVRLLTKTGGVSGDFSA